MNSLKPKYSDSLNTHKTLIQNYERKQDELQKVRETKELVERELDTYEFESEAVSELLLLCFRLILK